MREDVSGDLSPSISFSKKGTKIQENIKENSQTARAAVTKNTRIVKRETYQAHLTVLEYQKDQERLTRSL